ncbi:capsular polysaccharide biosynthesis protein [Halocynthiibacter sp. C4]|uniref:capsular polysaccharide biosynthesis protein n=1 Tax=Halocynthiibacter sp. C4 TaxID=2992758 RepID=UPI00237A4364|nr:capsular polysaccharide biosynthesis protein [Halocynthiibacter sp. C4]MDE0589034.1 capsular polysaccharide biosynthesis protein [Halocynthiibacter sp. C4]
MANHIPQSGDAPQRENDPATKLFVYNGGFLTQQRVRRILALAGYSVNLGKPEKGDWVGVWGQSPTSNRGEAVSNATDTPILRVEDPFLRSVLPARLGGAPALGLLIDKQGVHFDPAHPSDLETLLATEPLDDTALLDRARDAISRINALRLSKYNNFLPDTPLPEPGYVLVIDQTRNDAAVLASDADEVRFKEMLVFAQTEHPGARIIIKSHPETIGGARGGYYNEDDESDRVQILSSAVSPQELLEGAIAVYTVSSQLGFEAIFAGHKPRVFGQPFYAGWGLTQDEYPVARRTRQLSRAQLFAAAMILYPKWYDPFSDRLCELEDVIETLGAEAAAWRNDHAGYVVFGTRAWKRNSFRKIFGAYAKLSFVSTSKAAIEKAKSSNHPILAWASKATDAFLTDANAAGVRVLQVEDGFIRSRGLGAALAPASSLIVDDLGVYYDPRRESRLEKLINASDGLDEASRHRAERLIRAITNAGLSKYNVSASTQLDFKKGHRILVVGQVEDDASIQKGCQQVRTNLALLQETRARNPSAILIYKPHPDVERGLRVGDLADEAVLDYADHIATETDPVSLLSDVNEVWTMTSLLGFEALIRGIPVTCLGTPFYAGWGLTTDLGEVPARRVARPDRISLAHAALIDAPRYYDPITNRICPPEVWIERLSDPNIDLPTPAPLRILSRLQDAFSDFAALWRR